MAAAAGIGAAGSILGGVLGGKGAKSAAKIQAAAADRATQSQMQMYQTTRSDLAPFLQGGNQAFSQLARIFGFGPTMGGAGAAGAAGASAGGSYVSGPNGEPIYLPAGAMPGSTPVAGGDAYSAQPDPAFASELLTKFPGYQFGRDQGLLALSRQAAPRWGVLGGAQLRDATQFGTDYALASAWQPYISELNSAASLGENAGAQVGNAGSEAGKGIAATELAAGEAQAGGVVGATNAYGQAVNSLANRFSSYVGGSGMTVSPNMTNATISGLGDYWAQHPGGGMSELGVDNYNYGMGG